MPNLSPDNYASEDGDRNNSKIDNCFDAYAFNSSSEFKIKQKLGDIPCCATNSG